MLGRRMLDTAVVFAGLLAEGGAGDDAARGKVEAKIRVGSQSERPRAPNQALARGSWRPRSASEASRKGQ